MKEILENGTNKLCKAIGEVNFEDKRVYANYLAQTYYYVNHSCNLLGLAISKMFGPDKRFQKRFGKHVGEEDRHELLAKKDLERLGFSLEDFPELFETSDFYTSQYWKTQNEDCLSLLGYIVALEHFAIHGGPMIYEKAGGGTFLKVHIDEDEDHVVHAIDMIESLPEERQKVIIKNIRHTQEGFLKILMALENNREKVAA